MAIKDQFSPAFLRELALSFPEVQDVLIERRQIEQDAKAVHTYRKFTPQPKPDGDLYFSKIHELRMDDTVTKRAITKQHLKDNAIKLGHTLEDRLHKAGISEAYQDYKTMTPQELVTFLEKGHDAMLQEREERQQWAIESGLKMSPDEYHEFVDRCQDVSDAFIENKKDQQLDVKHPAPSDNFE